MVIVMYRVRVCEGVPASTLEVLSADKTPVDVDIRERDRADLFEVEIKYSSVDLMSDQICARL